MSLFEVKVRKLDDILPHPNADRLELAVIGGYKAVVKKGVFRPNEYALYIPTDSVLDYEAVEGLGIATYLSGKHKNRVKAVRLRGEVSQGIVVHLDVLCRHANRVLNSNQRLLALFKDRYINCADDLAEFLGIYKYEEEVLPEMKGVARRWPSYLDHYDVENVNHPDCIHVFAPNEEVYVTEKLHGTNIAVSIGPGLESGESAYVCSRNVAIREKNDNLYWNVARKYCLIEKLYQLKDSLGAKEEVTLRGEVVGIQDLSYGFTKTNLGFFAFDIRVDGQYLDVLDFRNVCEKNFIPVVPLIYHGPYDYEHLKSLATGFTLVGDKSHIREGVVVRPAKERWNASIGRVILKFLNEDYLTRSNGTELH